MALASSDKTAETEKVWATLDLDEVQEKSDRGKKLNPAEKQFLAAHKNGGFAHGPRSTPPRPANPRRLARQRTRSARKLNRT